MYNSIEVRWFLPFSPQEILEWFESQRSWSDRSIPLRFANYPETHDQYFIIDDYNKFSFKLRDGNIELKTQEEPGHEKGFSPTICGLVEKWIKWEVELKEDTRTRNDIFKNATMFLSIAKKRMLLKYSITNGKIKLIDPDNNGVTEGGQVELTQIKIDNALHYSFAFESFGTKETLHQNFDTIADKIAGEITNTKLVIGDSYSYPEFLKRLSNSEPVYA